MELEKNKEKFGRGKFHEKIKEILMKKEKENKKLVEERKKNSLEKD